MNPRAAKELLDVIMLDEYVARRKALDDWSRRWIATMHVEALNVHNLSEAREAKKQLLTEILNGLVQDEVNVLHWGHLISNNNSLACEMHVVMQQPRELDA